jgi:alpha-galactosidase
MNRTMPKTICLHGQASSVVIDYTATSAPVWRYWGARLHDRFDAASLPHYLTPEPPATLATDAALTLAPTYGAGWFQQPALRAHRQGRDFAQQWQRITVEPLATNKIRFLLVDSIAKISLAITLALDAATDVLTITTTLNNDGDDALNVDWCASATLPLPVHVREVESLHGVWANEFQVARDKLSRSTWRRDNNRGRTSHDNFPAAVILCEGLCEGAMRHTGHVYGAQLGWSGNHTQFIEWLDDGSYQWQLGEAFAPGEVMLLPAESITLAPVMAAFSSNGLNGLAQSFHAAIHANLPWRDGAMPPRRVHLNTWEAVYFQQSEADLMALATSAAALGVERFVLDDGWFHGRTNDKAGLGDWWADSQKYPQGLMPLARHVEALGMSFGLWVEPEMVNPDSDLYRQHPDWVLHVAGRDLILGRHQLVLNLANADVAEYLFQQLSQLCSTLPIAYLKWDMNRDLAMAANVGRASYRAQVLALYQLLKRLNEAFLQLEIESCASGGGRADAGILQFTHRVWTSDSNDATSRIAIQRGAMQWLPPAILGAHVGATPSHTTGRSQSLNFRAAVALGGHFGCEMDVRALDAQSRNTLQQWISLYQRLRHQLHHGVIWQGEAGDDVVWQAHGSQSSLILLIYRLEPTTQRYPPTMSLPMLDATRRYTIERLDPHEAAPKHTNEKYLFDEINAQGVTLDGDWLINHGLTLPRMMAETAMVLTLNAVSE